MWVTENQLDQWVRGNARDAQGLTVELVWRLAAVSSPTPRERRFPLGDSVGQHGPDGVLDVDLGLDPWVPDGRSFWEIGTGVKAGDKATSDYKDLVTALPSSVRQEATFVFVTPLSGARDWEHTWKEDAQARWLEDRRGRAEWKDVRVIDGTKLIDWVRQFPTVALWLAQRMTGLTVPHIETPEQRWDVVRSIGEPPPLVTQLFLSGREEAKTKVGDVFADRTKQLKLATRYPDQVVDFVCAYLADLDEESRADAAGRCLVVSSMDAWSTIVAQRERHVLVADATLDLSGDVGTKLIQKARRAGHAVIFGGPPGGIPDPTSASLRSPGIEGVREALQKAGYGNQRARTLAQRSGGNLGSLLRCVQNLSVSPIWADGSAAADLAIAELLGGWSEAQEGDRSAAEELEGNAYGEWVVRLRDAALRPGTPLVLQEGRWKFIARFEGWYALGPRVFDEHLDRLGKVAVTVLRELDPQFDLAKEERFAADVYGKTLTHSRQLRTGLAETLALLGSHPRALTSCSLGKAEATAVLTVRALLTEADWVRWASLNDVLSLLAESAPQEFLDCLEATLDARPEVFDALFEQEGNGLTGRTYITGLLWALETLAWEPTHLIRVVVSLAALADRDPGGQWSNRPANSLRSILLPWLPQTSASFDGRIAAVATVLREHPDVGWKLLLHLLPEAHSSSSYTSRPAWRESIPEEWDPGVTNREYVEQVTQYATMAANMAKGDLRKLRELLQQWEHLPPSTQEMLRAHLRSDTIGALSDGERYELWSEIENLVNKHRRFVDAEWAMDADQVDQLAELADLLTPRDPGARHRRLFGEQEQLLYEERGDYAEQQRRLDDLREQAVAEIAIGGGPEAVVAFAKTVESPWRVGIAYGTGGESGADGVVLPALLSPERGAVALFAGGFVWGRYRRHGWEWADSLRTDGWSAEQIGQLLSFLPFASETWDRAEQTLGKGVGEYWRRAAANPYSEGADLGRAVQALLQHRRPHAAIQCIHRLLHDSSPVEPAVIVRALMDAVRASDSPQQLREWEAVEIIKVLQDDPRANPDDLFRVEWAYLPLLEEHRHASPKFLGSRLASDPAFFCELIRLVFRPKGSEAVDEVTEEAKVIARNAYRLLSEWRVPPGLCSDGTYDGAALTSWMDAMKEEAAASGHLEVAMTMAGQALTYVPPDSDGLWIHRSAAEVLNARDAGDLRDGFRNQVLNARGAHWVDPSGRPEDELAEQYRKQADQIEASGYHRLATSMREVARSYEREAEWVRSRERLGE
jgi:hypothetical protein